MSRLGGRVTVVGLLVALALAGTSCGGNPQCEQLQARFDQAKDGAAYSVMEATDKKMADSGCYG
jgi:hypothetical protein